MTGGTNVSTMPIWAQYVQIFGPLGITVIAAVIASGIQLRQWKTAHDKLRLDLFERRLKIVDALDYQIGFGAPTDVKSIEIRTAVDQMRGYQYLFPLELEYFETVVLTLENMGLLAEQHQFDANEWQSLQTRYMTERKALRDVCSKHLKFTS